MTKQSHTPGPWVIDGFNTSSVLKCTTPKGHPDSKHLCGDYEVIARCEGENWKANANLIAAAPELLEALEKAVADYGKEGGPWNVPSEPGTWIEMARAAIAKAKGE